MTPEVSVIVPCFGQAQFLGAALSSLERQSFKAWEAVVVVSDDESMQCATWWSQKDLRIRAIHQPPAGVSAARNAGVEGARAQYLLALDADDWLDPLALGGLIWAIPPGRFAIAYSNVQVGPSRQNCWSPVFGLAAVRVRNCLPYAALHTRAVHEQAGGWPVEMIGYEDWAYWVSASRVALDARYVVEPLVIRRVWHKQRSKALDPWHNVWVAMIHELYPDLYERDAAAVREDRMVIAQARGLLDRLRERARAFPASARLGEWVALIEGRVPI